MEQKQSFILDSYDEGTRQLIDGKKVVLKIGTELLVKKDTIGQIAQFKINNDAFQMLATDITHLKSRGTSVVIVSSGAVACGRAENQRLHQEMLSIEQSLGRDKHVIERSQLTKSHGLLKQRAAGIGQIILSELWRQAFKRNNLYTEQILVDDNNLELGIESICHNLDSIDTISIANANDAISHSNVQTCADNDTLAQLIASGIHADYLIYLTQSGGILDEQKQLITYLSANENYQIHDHGKTSSGTGGIISKFQTAKFFAQRGRISIITSNEGLFDLINGRQSGTWIY